jgi:hypothetical protein
MDPEVQARVQTRRRVAWTHAADRSSSTLLHPPGRAAPIASRASRPLTRPRASTPEGAARWPTHGSSVAEAESGTTMAVQRRSMGRKRGTQRRWWGSTPEHPRPSSTPSPPLRRRRRILLARRPALLAPPPCRLPRLQLRQLPKPGSSENGSRRRRQAARRARGCFPRGSRAVPARGGGCKGEERL